MPSDDVELSVFQTHQVSLELSLIDQSKTFDPSIKGKVLGGLVAVTSNIGGVESHGKVLQELKGCDVS